MSDEKKKSFEKLDKELSNADSNVANMVSEAPAYYKDCDILYKSCKGHPKNNEMPVYLGKDKLSGKYLLGVGSDNPLSLEENQLFFLMNSFSGLIKECLSDEHSLDNQEFIARVIKSGKSYGTPTFAKGIGPGEESSFLDESDKIESEIDTEDQVTVTNEEGDVIDLKSLVDKLHILKDSKEKAEEDEDEDELEKIAKGMEDLAKIIDSLSPEEKEQIEKESALQREELLLKRSKEFEKQLLGEIEIEGEINYNYEYFKGIYVDNGLPALKEELAKIPKEERGDIIDKITEEFKNRNNKEEDNNTKAE